MRDISKIVCYQLLQRQNYSSLKKKQLTFLLLQSFPKLQTFTYNLLRMCAYVTGNVSVYTVCSQFKHYVGLVNLPHSSIVPCSPNWLGHIVVKQIWCCRECLLHRVHCRCVLVRSLKLHIFIE